MLATNLEKVSDTIVLELLRELSHTKGLDELRLSCNAEYRIRAEAKVAGVVAYLGSKKFFVFKEANNSPTRMHMYSGNIKSNPFVIRIDNEITLTEIGVRVFAISSYDIEGEVAITVLKAYEIAKKMRYKFLYSGSPTELHDYP